MSLTSENNKRIAKNTGMLYVRMLLMMCVTLYTSRVVLEALGVEDYGINNVVAGFVSILGFYTSSLSNAAQRYLSLGLGQNNHEMTVAGFRQCFTLMLVISVLIFFLGETIGLWFVCNKLVIPPERLSAAIWLYQFALISMTCSINQVSFVAVIIAREKMNFYAYLGLLEAFSRLAVAYVLIIARSDLLILFGALTAISSVLSFSLYVWYCRKSFDECVCKMYWNAPLVKEMSGFIGYNLFGCFAWSAGIQGVNILLNLFFGPLVNAARAVAVQISAAVSRFTDSIMTAVKPPIIKSYSSGNVKYMMMLIEKSSKYSFMLACLIVFPVLFETELVLHLWLGKVPEYAVVFTRLVLCEQLVGVLVPPLWIAANATGNIKNSQVFGRLFTLSVLPISYFLLFYIKNPALPMILLVIAQIGYWLYNLYDIHRQVQLDLSHYFRRVILPSTLLVSIVYLIGEILQSSFSPSLLRLIVMGCCMLLAVVFVFLIMSEPSERDFVRKMIKKKF